MIEVSEVQEIINITLNETTESVIINTSENEVDITLEVAEMGAQGLKGKSNYEIAVENGFTGTQIEWLESQKNVDGGLIY